jgi:hypothetical protein
MAVGSDRGPGGAGWVCPNCRRRVPRYAPVCHCGTRRTDAVLVEGAATAATPGRRDPLAPFRGLPVSFWLLVGAILLCAVGMVVRLNMPWQAEPMIPLLGHADRMPAGPVPTPAR